MTANRIYELHCKRKRFLLIAGGYGAIAHYSCIIRIDCHAITAGKRIGALLQGVEIGANSNQ